MKPNGPIKTIALLFVAVLAFYVVTYSAIEHRRARKGPWIVTFTNTPAAALTLRIDQPALAISNVQIAFPSAATPSNFSARTVVFDRPRPVPFPLPAGDCIFMDTTFLPGAIVLRVGGRDIQLIPRVLTIDDQERPWHSGEIISIDTVGTNTLHQTPGER